MLSKCSAVISSNPFFFVGVYLCFLEPNYFNITVTGSSAIARLVGDMDYLSPCYSGFAISAFLHTQILFSGHRAFGCHDSCDR